MSFISSLYRTAPQTFIAVAGNSYAINPIDPNYTRVVIAGPQSSDFTGTVNPSTLWINIINANTIQAAGQGQSYITIEEYVNAFFKQAFLHSYVTIPSTQTQGSTVHGLTLGPKAFVVSRGSTSNRAASTTGLSLTEAQVRPTLQLTSTHVIAYVQQADYPTGPGIVQVGFTLIDPR